MAEEQIRALQHKVQDLQVMKSTLEHLVHYCHGDDRPECPILDVLAGSEPVGAGHGGSLRGVRRKTPASMPAFPGGGLRPFAHPAAQG